MGPAACCHLELLMLTALADGACRSLEGADVCGSRVFSRPDPAVVLRASLDAGVFWTRLPDALSAQCTTRSRQVENLG